MENTKTVFDYVVSDIKDYIVYKFRYIYEELIRKKIIPKDLVFKLPIENIKFSYINYNPLLIVFYAISEIDISNKLKEYLENISNEQYNNSIDNVTHIIREELTKNIKEHFNNIVDVFLD